MIGALLIAGLLQAGEPDALGGLIASLETETTEAADPYHCIGEVSEGALLVCRTLAEADIHFGEQTTTADGEGWFLLGIPREADERLTLSIRHGGQTVIAEHPLIIAQREYNIQRVEGVPQRTVTPDPSTLERRQREYAQKQAAFNSVWDGRGFLDGFIAPSEGVTTGVYGSQRVYNGSPGNPHWGLDWANDVGTPVHAPASGRIVLAEPDMYYEGGLVFLDHGQGLVSAFLHMSAVHVSEGDLVQQGDLIGEIGAGGRATGPHLDWRVKLRNGFYVDPAMLLDLDMSGAE